MKQRVIGIYEMESPLARAGGDPLPTLVRRSSPHGVLAFLISDVFDALHRVIDLVNGSTIKEPISKSPGAPRLAQAQIAIYGKAVQSASVYGGAARAQELVGVPGAHEPRQPRPARPHLAGASAGSPTRSPDDR